MERPPPPGVSTIGIDGSRTPVEVEDAPQQTVSRKTGKPVRGNTAPRPVGRKTDVLANPEQGRRVSNPIPAGVQGKESEIIELPMPQFRIPKTSTAEFKSVDGNTYTFRTKDTKGRPLAWKNELCLFLAMVEMSKGGNPLTVFSAFKLKLEDMHGQTLFPLPEGVEDILRGLVVPEGVPEDEEVEEAADKGFSFGE